LIGDICASNCEIGDHLLLHHEVAEQIVVISIIITGCIG